MSPADVMTGILMLLGSVFFLAGTVGILRFPDVYTRLHALTKADNLGVGLLVCALMLQASSGYEAIKLLLVWMLIMFSSSLSAFMVANAGHRSRIKPWKKNS